MSSTALRKARDTEVFVLLAPGVAAGLQRVLPADEISFNDLDLRARYSVTLELLPIQSEEHHSEFWEHFWDTLACSYTERIGRLQGAAFDFVFIDTPGIDSPGVNVAISVSDLCLIPCRPTPADLRSVSPTLAAIHRLGKDFAFVLNQTPPKGFRVRDTSEGLKVLGMLADVAMVMRNDHQDAIGSGQGVTEFNPEGAAAGEIRQLWAWIDNRTKGLPHVEAA
jgi:cellulose biosynthesis protein BcsQ